jgi:hypothetical protein
MIKRFVMALLLTGLCVFPAAASEPDWQNEVDYLLSYVEQSGCSFIRNDKVYDSVQAREHISKKYDYVKKRINTAEQFITYAASKSSITGKSYQVTCGDTTRPSSAWLEEALVNYRKAQ